MPLYKFTAMDSTGGEHTDTIEAEDIEDVKQQIRSMGYFPTFIAKTKDLEKLNKNKNDPFKNDFRCYTFTIR